MAIRTGVGSVLVDDGEIIAPRTLLWQRQRLAVEHAAAASLAVLLAGSYQPKEDERVAVVLCGANTDLTDLV